MDYAYRWQQNSPEYQWLQNDLQTHPSQLKFAIFHYPLYVDNATEPSDTFLQGPNSLEGLLTANGVNMVFNGHAHLYERNNPTSDGLVSYVTGGGGAKPEPISHCKPYDAYGIGWSQSSRREQVRHGGEAHRDRSGVPLPAGRRERLTGHGDADQRARSVVRRTGLRLLTGQHAAERAVQPAGDRARGQPRGSDVGCLERRERRRGVRHLPRREPGRLGRRRHAPVLRHDGRPEHPVQLRREGARPVGQHIGSEQHRDGDHARARHPEPAAADQPGCDGGQRRPGRSDVGRGQRQRRRDRVRRLSRREPARVGRRRDARLQRPDGDGGHAVQLHGAVARRGGATPRSTATSRW